MGRTAVVDSGMTGRADMILDLETLGTEPGSVVLQVGAIAFNSYTRVELARFERNIDIGSQLLVGLTVDPKTLHWWGQQSREAQASVFAPGVSISAAVRDFMLFWGACGCTDQSRIWARGTDFDPTIWAAAMTAAETVVPWQHHLARDVRTLLEDRGVDREAIMRRGIRHRAVADAEHDLDCMRAAQRTDNMWSDPALRHRGCPMECLEAIR